jgi:hypothetical protein
LREATSILAARPSGQAISDVTDPRGRLEPLYEFSLIRG